MSSNQAFPDKNVHKNGRSDKDQAKLSNSTPELNGRMAKQSMPVKSTKSTRALVGPEVVARVLDVSRNSVINWAKDGAIPAIIIVSTYRFDPVALGTALNLDPELFV